MESTAVEPMTPRDLRDALTKIIAEECGCSAAWSQHEGPLTSGELYRIRSRFEMLLRGLVTDTVDREIDARRREDAIRMSR